MFSRLLTWSIAAWSLAICCGCVNQQKEVSLYRRVLEKEGSPQVPALPQEKPLTLRQALLLANQHNERLASSGEDYLQAIIDKDRAFAGFLPTVSLAPSFLMLDRPEVETPSLKQTVLKQVRTSLINSVVSGVTSGLTGTALPNASSGGSTGGTTGGTSGGSTGASTGSLGGGTSMGTGGISNFRVRDNTLQRTSVPVTVQMNLFNGFRDEAALKAAEADINQREQSLLDLQITVLLEVAQTYYQVLRSQSLSDVLRNSLSVQDERVRDIRGRYTAGLARPLDVAQSEAQAANTRGLLVRAMSNVRNGRTTLAFLIGVPGVGGPLSDEFSVPEALETIERYQQRAAESRQDLLAARAAVEAARAGVDVAVGQYYPSISINLNAFLYDENFENASKWNGLISANLPLFSAGLIEADVRTAFSRLRQALLNESLIRRQVCQDVGIAYEDVQASRELLRNLDVQVAAASQAFHQAEQNYNVGFATNLERLTALDQFLSAQLQMASEIYNQKVYYLQLLRVMGRLREDVLDRATTMPSPTSKSSTSPAQ